MSATRMTLDMSDAEEDVLATQYFEAELYNDAGEHDAAAMFAHQCKLDKLTNEMIPVP